MPIVGFFSGNTVTVETRALRGESAPATEKKKKKSLMGSSLQETTFALATMLKMQHQYQFGEQNLPSRSRAL